MIPTTLWRSGFISGTCFIGSMNSISYSHMYITSNPRYMYKNDRSTISSPIQRPRYTLKARRQPSVESLRRVIERENQAVGDDRLVVGILPIRSSCEILLVHCSTEFPCFMCTHFLS